MEFLWGRICSKDQDCRLWATTVIWWVSCIVSKLRQGPIRHTRACTQEDSNMTLFLCNELMLSMAQWKARSSADSLDPTKEYDRLLWMSTLPLQSLTTKDASLRLSGSNLLKTLLVVLVFYLIFEVFMFQSHFNVFGYANFSVLRQITKTSLEDFNVSLLKNFPVSRLDDIPEVF